MQGAFFILGPCDFCTVPIGMSDLSDCRTGTWLCKSPGSIRIRFIGLICLSLHPCIGFGKTCAPNSPVFPCKHPTLPAKYKQFLAFPSRSYSFTKVMFSFFLFAFHAKRKSEHKKFWKRKGGYRGNGKNLFQKFFPFPLAGRVPQRIFIDFPGLVVILFR